jgi:hypothetical protein
MVYSDTTNKNGILQMIEQTTNLGDAAVTGNTVLKAYFTNLINQWYRTAAYYAWSVDKDWVFDDSNQTTLPQATTTLVNNQRDYSLPSTDLRVRQVEVMASNGLYSSLVFMPENSPILYTEKEQENAGVPTMYRLVGNSIILYPKPDTSQVTAAAGLRVTTDRDVSPFVVSDTTKEPGFAATFHPILYYGPCLEWATVKGVAGTSQLCNRMLGNFQGMTEMFKDFMSKRNQDTPQVLIPAYKNFK